MTGAAPANRVAGVHGGEHQHGRSAGGGVGGGGAPPVGGAGRVGSILDELTAVTGWHRKHAVRALRAKPATQAAETLPRKQRYNAAIRDAVTALWEASDRVCGKRLKVMIPALLPALARHGRLTLSCEERALLLSVSAATIDRMLVDVKIAAAGGRRRRVGFYSAIRREMPIRTSTTGPIRRPASARSTWSRTSLRILTPFPLTAAVQD
jgi:hypothetical protein